MSNELNLYQGRLKTFNMQWFQGSPSGAPLDTTGATITVSRNTLKAAPTITAVDESLGQYQLSFSGDSTVGISPGQPFSLLLSLTLPGGSGFSPDPVLLTGYVR